MHSATPAFSTSVRNAAAIPAYPSQSTSMEQLASDAILPGLAGAIGAEELLLAVEMPGDNEARLIPTGARCSEAGITAQHLVAEIDSGVRRWGGGSASETRRILLTAAVPMGDGARLIVGMLFRGSDSTARAQARTAFDRVRPLLGEIIGLQRRLLASQTRLRACRAALDRYDVGVVLLGPMGEALMENRTAKLLLDEGSGLRRQGRALAARDLTDTARLRVAIDHVASMDQSTPGDSAPVLALQRGRNRRPLLVSVVPPGVELEQAGGVSALLYLFDPERDVARLLKAACRLYGLSPSETALACQLACGVSLAEAAVTLRVKEQTARGYLKQVFMKADVNRQAALVQLLHASMVRLCDDLDPQLF